MASTHTLTGNVYDLTGATLGATGVRVTVVTNLPAKSALIDKTTNSIHLGGKHATLDHSTGEFSIELIDTSATDLNVAANTLEYEVRAEYANPATRARSTWTSGWFPFTADANLADIATDVEPLAVESASEYAAAAAASAAQAEAISGLTGEDAAVALLVEDSGSATAGALSATYATPRRVRSKIKADGTNQTAALLAEVAALGPDGGELMLPEGEIVFTGTLTDIIRPKVSLVGAAYSGAPLRYASAGTILSHEPTTPSPFMTSASPGVQPLLWNVGLKGLVIRGNANSTVGVELTKVGQSVFEDVSVTGFAENIVTDELMLCTFKRVISTEARASCLTMTGSTAAPTTTTLFDECYVGQTLDTPTARPLIIDKDALLGVDFKRFTMESTELGASIGSGNVVTFSEPYTENIPHTSAAVAIFEIGKTGAPGVASSGGNYTFLGGTIAGTNAGVHAGSSIFDADYAHSIVAIGTRFARANTTLRRTTNTKAPTFIGTSDLQVTNGIQTADPWSVMRVGNFAGTYGARFPDTYADRRAMALTATASLNFPSIAASGFQSLTMTLDGAVTGDVVLLGPPAGLQSELVPYARVTAANTVTVCLFNPTGSAIDPPAATWRASTIRGEVQFT